MQAIEDLRQALFSLERVQQQVLAAGSVLVGGLVTYLLCRNKEANCIPLCEDWWVEGVRPVLEDENIHPFTVTTNKYQIQDLHERIDKTRYTDPLNGSCFQYGFNSNYLHRVVSYWRNIFDWNKQITVLNKYPHFKTNIDGLDVHFIHVHPPHREGQKVVPLMLVNMKPLLLMSHSPV